MGTPRTDEPRTYVMVGVPRGGTSMVAGLARLAGVPLGEGLSGNQEDPAFNIEQLRKSGVDPIASMVATIEARNAEHDVWGWKYPRAVRYLDDLRPHLRNPHLVVVIRDPVASAGRPVGQAGADAMDTIEERYALMGRNLDLVKRWQVPTLMVSYERGIDKPLKLMAQLARFLGVEKPSDRRAIRKFVQPGTYQRLG